MAGVTDVAFRLLCKKYGVSLTVTEMISANAIARNNKATIKMIDVVKEEQPRVIQLFGQNTNNLVKAAKYCEDKCEIIDLNLGISILNHSLVSKTEITAFVHADYQMLMNGDANDTGSLDNSFCNGFICRRGYQFSARMVMRKNHG